MNENEPSDVDAWVRGMVEENTLGALDFEAKCTVCDADAAWFIGLACCEHTTVMCLGCYARWETVIALNMGRETRCRGCGHADLMSWDLYRTERI